MAIGVGPEMAHKPSVILELLEQQFLASKQWIRRIQNDTNVAILHIRLRVPIQGRILPSDGRRHSTNHPTHRLNNQSHT